MPPSEERYALGHARHAGRIEDQAARRGAFYLRRAGEDPGLTGLLSQAWQRLAERDPPDKAVRLFARTFPSGSQTPGNGRSHHARFCPGCYVNRYARLRILVSADGGVAA